MWRLKKQLSLSPFSPIPAATSPVLPRPQAQRDMWESLQGKTAALAKRRKGVNRCMRERGVRSPSDGADSVCIPWGKGYTWRRQVRYRKIYSQSTDLKLSHKPIKLPTRTTQFPAILSQPSFLSQNSLIFVLLYNLILPPQKPFGQENLILCVLLGSLEIAL